MPYSVTTGFLVCGLLLSEYFSILASESGWDEWVLTAFISNIVTYMLIWGVCEELKDKLAVCFIPGSPEGMIVLAIWVDRETKAEV